ncbi:MAG TPA: DUF2309 domain-containing protein [Bacteroidia bacterium]
MNDKHSTFNEHDVLHHLSHYLPAQAPLKDFIHHNSLHAFQHLKFFTALRNASEMFGYKISLSLDEFRALYNSNRIDAATLERVIAGKKGAENIQEWKDKVLTKQYDTTITPRVGTLRANWKKIYNIDLDSYTHPLLFRILCSYLDQGVSISNFPIDYKGFLSSLREMEKNSFTSFFKTKKAKQLLLHGNCEIEHLLKLVVGDESLYTHYLYDQQFAHQGWSGMVCTVELDPASLLDRKKITLQELIIFELLLEIDRLDSLLGETWKPLGIKLENTPPDIFADIHPTELSEVLAIWQDAYEWRYYDEVLSGIKKEKREKQEIANKTFQAMFCLDDRECSIRRYVEKLDTSCETFGTPGFFGVEFYFQPDGGKFYTKLCPAPVTPKYLIKEFDSKAKRRRDEHLSKQTHSLFSGWIISQTVGFWAAIRLFLNVFKPAMTPGTASSFKHMDKDSQLNIENKNISDIENGLQVGFTIDEMVQRVEGLLKSIGLVKDFAPLIYIIGHGASSVNNTYFAGYDCGACYGRPGSVNAKVMAFMANHPKVREILVSKGVVIPSETQFIGALHDTTIDEISFFGEQSLSVKNLEIHRKNEITLKNALDLNAKERSRRFASVDTTLSDEQIHDKIRQRAVALFEPRPEYNHATNTLCIVGGRYLTKSLFLDRRAFMNSYDYRIDPEGKFLFNVMKPLGPVCGGINLEYFFSRVDNQKLGAGSKLPHNVMGLFGVANGTDGDLRPGLPYQMIEIHDPVRLLIIVEHFPEVVLNTIKSNDAVYEWFINEWVHLIAINPETQEYYLFQEGAFTQYQPLIQNIETPKNLTHLFELTQENLPVYSISN